MEMSTPNSGSGSNAANRPPLTEEQKKMNHIASEQQRRHTIRGVFDQLSELVPGMKGEARSEAKVLQATVDYMREEMAKKEILRTKMYAKGWTEQQFESHYASKDDETPTMDGIGNGTVADQDTQDDPAAVDEKVKEP